MTSSSPFPSSDPPATPATEGGPPYDELDPPKPVWHLANCYRDEMGEPFRDPDERDAWALTHAEATGHVVHLAVETPVGDPGMASDLHLAVAIRCFPGSVWRWCCPAESCCAQDGAPKWNGPYPTGQVALASWRGHGTKR
jgi:hypothetical protein